MGNDAGLLEANETGKQRDEKDLDKRMGDARPSMATADPYEVKPKTPVDSAGIRSK